MSDELFSDIPETLAPWKEFQRRHGIKTCYYSSTGGWTAARGREMSPEMPDEKRAVEALAEELDLEGWRSIAW